MNLPLTRMETTLSNGMKVILVRKPGFAQSMFMMGIPAGSANRVDQMEDSQFTHPSGCAHYLEHQMFRLNGEDVTYPLARASARTNAYTSYEQTCYFVWTNSDPTECLKLLIQFVQNLEISDETVNKEKGIILSEYAQYHQDPYSRLMRETFASLYHTHYFREEILGSPQDIQAMRAEDLKRFYDVWYDPGQLTLVGVTGRELEPILNLIKKEEENYPRKYPVPATRIDPVEPETVCRKTVTIPMDVEMTYCALGIKLDPCKGDERQAIREDYMLNIWLASQFSPTNPAYQDWINERLISASGNLAEGDIDVDHSCILVVSESERPDAFFAAMKKILAKKEPISAEDFETQIIKNKASAIRLADQYDNLCTQLIEGSFKGFDPLEDQKVLESLSLEEVNDFIASLDFDRQVEVRVVPLETDEETEEE